MFTENQIFYAALWWVNALPGGPAHVPAILARYDRDPIEFPPHTSERKPRKWREVSEHEQAAFIAKHGADERNENIPQAALDFLRALGMNMNEPEIFSEIEQQEINRHPTPEQLDIFFDCLFAATKEAKSFQHADSHSENRTFIELQKTGIVSSNHPAYPDEHYSDEIEHAIAEAGIQRRQLPYYASLTLHNDGQLFIATKSTQKDWKTVPCSYPGQPPLPYRRIDLGPRDLDHCPHLTWESLYRIVPLKAGQHYKYGWITVKGDRHESESIARDGEVLVIGNTDVDDLALLETLTDEEIINFDPRLKGCINSQAKKYEDGAKDQYSKTVTSNTDRPGIIKRLTPDIPYMKVKDGPVQFGSGYSFNVAQPGDYIIRDSENSMPRVIKKELVESGRVRFIFDDRLGPGPSPGAPRPQ